MYNILLVLIIVVSLLLVLVIMVQNPKGGGLSGTFGGGGTQIGGAQKTTDFLDKSTWTLATVLVALILLINVSGFNSSNSRVQEAIDDNTAPIENTTTEEPLTTPEEGENE
ncbi:MAG: preprotein translocase subunit SecG [Flavobacteriaceae bacterium]|nr:preprotein translocase subunit SecG [Flavobacteriaceae bacterium]